MNRRRVTSRCTPMGQSFSFAAQFPANYSTKYLNGTCCTAECLPNTRARTVCWVVRGRFCRQAQRNMTINTQNLRALSTAVEKGAKTTPTLKLGLVLGGGAAVLAAVGLINHAL